MLKFICLLVIFCLCRYEVLAGVASSKIPEKVIYQLDDIDGLFKEFVVKYDKQYDSEEVEYRRSVFLENLKKINQWNREQPDTVYGINLFTDLTFEEFVETHTGVRGNYTYNNVMKFKPTGTAPDSLDWRNSNLVTEVKDQKRCGSCYIFSAIGNIEGQHAKQTGQLISLSEQQNVDCYSRGCNGGWPHDVMQSLASTGCMSESDYPYVGTAGQCRMDASKVAVKVTGGSKLDINSEDALKDAVASYGPLSIVIAVNNEFQSLTGGVFRPTTPCSGQPLHALLLIGYGTDGSEPYWLIKNSWGPNWNENGYVRMIRGQGACDIGTYAACATVA